MTESHIEIPFSAEMPAPSTLQIEGRERLADYEDLLQGH